MTQRGNDMGDVEQHNPRKMEVRTPLAPRPGGAFSQAIQAGDFIFVAGQGPVDPSTGTVIGVTIEDQTTRTIENVAAILRAAGASLADVVKVTVHLADVDDFPAFDAVYERLFPRPWPVRTTVGSTLVGIRIEVDVIALVAQ